MVHSDDVNLNNALEDDDSVSGVRKPHVVYVDVGKEFNTEQKLKLYDRMLKWVRVEAIKLGFGIIIVRSYFDFDRISTFTTMRCEWSGENKEHIRKFKCDDTRTRKCGCPIKLRGYHMAKYIWTFIILCGGDNHGLNCNLIWHPIVIYLYSNEKKIVVEMTMKMV